MMAAFFSVRDMLESVATRHPEPPKRIEARTLLQEYGGVEQELKAAMAGVDEMEKTGFSVLNATQIGLTFVNVSQFTGRAKSFLSTAGAMAPQGAGIPWVWILVGVGAMFFLGRR